MNGSTTIEAAEFEPAIADTSGICGDVAVLADRELASDAATQSRPFYGWYMLLMAMGASIASSPGQTFGISIFNEPLRLELGFSHGQLSLAYMLGTLFGAAPIVWIGYQMDRRGLRVTMLAVIALFSLTCVGMSLTQSWLQVVIAFTFLRMLGPGALSLLSGNVLPFWFHARLGTVEGLRQTAMAMAMAVIPPLNVWLVSQFGWRSAYAILGGSVFLLLFPAYWRFFRQHPEEVGQLIDGRRPAPSETARASSGSQSQPPPSDLTFNSLSIDFSFKETLRTAAFWLILSGTSLYGMIQTGVFFCLVPIFFEQGFSEQHAASMLIVYAISLACSQVFGGWLADRVEPWRQLTVGLLLFAAGLMLLWLGFSFLTTLVAGALLGSAQAIYFASAQPLWARFYGRANLGKLRGVLMATNVATSSIGPLVVGVGHDVIGEFGPILFVLALMPLPFAVSSYWVRRPDIPTRTVSVS